MTASRARVRDQCLEPAATATPARPLRVVGSPRTTTMFTPAGEPIDVPLLDAFCSRCSEPWEWAVGMDTDLDRRASAGVVIETCPNCLDEMLDERWAAEPEPWEPE